ncbi:MAG: TadE/TadG family type IV pilus assembly protein [Phycicoccus sp.]
MMRLRRRESGHSAVEAALVTPVVILLLMSIVEFSLYFKNNLSASEAVKAGVRSASAQARNATYAQAAADEVQQAGGALNKGNIEALWIYKANAGNEFPIGYTSFANCGTCVKFAWDGTKFTPTYENWNYTSQVACVGANGPPDRIGVYLQVRHDAITRMIFGSITIRESDVIRFEPIPILNGCR